MGRRDLEEASTLGLRTAMQPLRTAPIVFLAALATYWFSAVLLGRTATPLEAYFDQLADSLLHGHTYLANPRWTSELTLYDGRWYVPFPPLAAFLLVPWVALIGVDRVNTVVFGVVVGALNVALAFSLLQLLAWRRWTKLQLTGNMWLTALWGVGSVHWYMSTLGSVWYLSQIATATFILLALCSAAATGSALVSGTALGLAMWGRPHVALTYPLLLAVGIRLSLDASGCTDWRRASRWGALACAPLFFSAAALLWYNYIRFGDPFNPGYQTQNVNQNLVSDLSTYGQFSLHYVWQNLWAMLLATPVWDIRMKLPLPSFDGMSLLLTTPALLYLCRARQRDPLVIGAWVSTALILIPLVTYYNTGWRQFGYRFSLDFMPPLLVLLAFAAGTRVTSPMRLLIAAGVAVNAWGVWWFFNPRFFR